MLEGYGLVALLLGLAAILLIGELLLPTHGVLGLVSLCSALGAIFAAARVNPWAGLILTLALAMSSPLIWTATMRSASAIVRHSGF